MYHNRKNVTRTTPNKTRCAGRMPKINVFFVAVVPVGTAVKFISVDGSLHGGASFLSASWLLNKHHAIKSQPRFNQGLANRVRKKQRSS